jgi:hypothetical protein
MRTSTRFTHGYSGYVNYGCRCVVCRDANRRAVAEQRASRRALTEANGGIAPVEKHGKRTTYDNWYCRCVPCTAANAHR